jgi:hypothetical protein
MAMAVNHIGARFHGLVLARRDGDAPPLQPPGEVRERVRDQVMAARGLDARALRELGGAARLRVEADVAAETALRLQQGRLTGTGNFVDLRV